MGYLPRRFLRVKNLCFHLDFACSEWETSQQLPSSLEFSKAPVQAEGNGCQILLFSSWKAPKFFSPKSLRSALAGGREGSSTPFKEQLRNSGSVKLLVMGTPPAVGAASDGKSKSAR
ncbi:uncharacterized protein LOC101176243 [Nomascus leucogenys]|uniref:uncharacterized protein LOC101176243 n=1 Tax=Nomascus leucogenys TaxID=61853 RepID=UPI0002ADB00C|nr:uncharacterized protein LOC101176243 [Nomascus leucogenys]